MLQAITPYVAWVRGADEGRRWIQGSGVPRRRVRNPGRSVRRPRLGAAARRGARPDGSRGGAARAEIAYDIIPSASIGVTNNAAAATPPRAIPGSTSSRSSRRPARAHTLSAHAAARPRPAPVRHVLLARPRADGADGRARGGLRHQPQPRVAAAPLRRRDLRPDVVARRPSTSTAASPPCCPRARTPTSRPRRHRRRATRRTPARASSRRFGSRAFTTCAKDASSRRSRGPSSRRLLICRQRLAAPRTRGRAKPVSHRGRRRRQHRARARRGARGSGPAGRAPRGVASRDRARVGGGAQGGRARRLRLPGDRHRPAGGHPRP